MVFLMENAIVILIKAKKVGTKIMYKKIVKDMMQVRHVLNVIPENLT